MIPFSDRQWFHFPPHKISFGGLDVRGCGYCVKRTRESWVVNRTLHEYCLVYWKEGSGIFHSDPSGHIPIRPGSLGCLFPGVSHSYGPADNGLLQEYWFVYEGSMASVLHQSLPFSQAKPLVHRKAGARLVDLFETSVRICAESARLAARARLPGILFQILVGASLSGRSSSAADGKYSWTREAIRRIATDPTKKWNLHALAKEYNVSYSLFRKRFSEAAGMPPLRFLNHERVFKASCILTDGAPIKETCFAVGFDDEHYFSRMFKKYNGKSPRDFVKGARYFAKGIS